VKNIFTAMLFPVFLSVGCQQPHKAKVDALFSDFTGDRPGASVLVVRDGRPVFVKSYGLAVLDGRIPATPETNYRLASVTKQFTAMSIMILVERGQLSLDDSLTKIFPGFPAYGAKVTVRHLLTHTSGLVAYEDLMDSTDARQVRDRDVLAMMASVDSTYFPPGSAYRYSNSGYAMLAMIVEKVSGKTFQEFLEENIFRPLGMKRSVAFVKGVNTVPSRAFGYTPGGNGFKDTDQSTTSAVLGDGGIYTSVADMFRWDQALYTEKLVSAAMLKLAFTSATLTSGEKTGYGFGWNVGEYRGHHRVFHDGSTCGFRNAIHRYPGDRFSVIVLLNRSIAEPDSLAERLADIFLMEASGK
jgi:CubicO group peptidase (beta-lactamase class C family)